MGVFVDRTGQKIGRWTVLRQVPRPNNRKGRGTWWLCRCECGIEKALAGPRFYKEDTISCGCYLKELLRSEKGPKNRGWKGGKHLNEDGYILLYSPSHHRAKTNGYVTEHTLIMEQKLGRSLLKSENVHHINGVKSDNRPENLELWVRSQPKGQRVSDLLVWANQIISLYDK